MLVNSVRMERLVDNIGEYFDNLNSILSSTSRAEIAVQVTKTLSNIVNQLLHPNTIHQHLKKSGLKAVVKKKRPLLSAKHRKEHLDWAYAHES